MNFIIDQVLSAIEQERPELAAWCKAKRHEMPEGGKLDALRWVVFGLDSDNRIIAARALGIRLSDFEPLKRVLQAIH